MLTDDAPPPDFVTPADIVRTVVAGERLAFGHQVNPVFATETALIDPLPHQRLAVYQQMLPQPRLRMLLADDAGAGKTIMAGLYLRELLSRRLIQRILIVPPAGLVTNWERELRMLFGLTARIVPGSAARLSNPFVGEESALLIVSLDTLAGERMFARLQEPEVIPYDLVIFDEAHKLSADREPDFRMRKTDRYRLAEVLAGVRGDDARWRLTWACRHVLLLSATPHMGKDYPYYCLWRLLEPEVFATFAAFQSHPPEARARSFLRRTKEEMVTFAGERLYPTRISDTVSYTLTQGAVSEQALYEQTTHYMTQTYNQARILNRAAARLAMSIFQRRLASSTAALRCSLERRLHKLEVLIANLQSGRLTEEQARMRQTRLFVRDTLDTTTADEEGSIDGHEQHEMDEDAALEAMVSVSLPDLVSERQEVQHLLDLARQVEDAGQESKLTQLHTLLRHPDYADEKAIIFTEHRDTLDFLVRRFEGMGLTGQIARLHGGMDSAERDMQVTFFRQPVAQGGAQYLVATDAAGEGINLQFCWLMINYDIPWNPARLEQRMGRIHRYGQTHDPVVILNLVAGSTREGKVLRVLLDKLERMRRELHSDKVFDVVGRLLEGESLTSYLARVLAGEDAEMVSQQLAGRLTSPQVVALVAEEQQRYGSGGDVQAHLASLRNDMEQAQWRRVLPGAVRRFLETGLPLLDLEVVGSLDTTFQVQARTPGALDALLPLLERYPAEQRAALTIMRPRDLGAAIYLRPGEPVFDRLRALVCGRFGADAVRGGVFVDPTTSQPYLLHVAVIGVERQADVSFPALARPEVRETRLVGIRQTADGVCAVCPVEELLLLKAGQGIPVVAHPLLVQVRARCAQARDYATDEVAREMVAAQRQTMLETLPERLEHLRRGFTYQESDLALARTKYRDKARNGDARARGELTRIKQQQERLAGQREAALALAQREPELLAVGEVTFIAHALVVPSSDPDDQRRFDAEVEALAMQVARAAEEAQGATVRDVSRPAGARAANLPDYPGFDLLSRRSESDERAIEVKGRARGGAVELTENEWMHACTLRERYWLYVVYDCATSYPRLLCVQDPFGKLVVGQKKSVVIAEGAIVEAAESV